MKAVVCANGTSVNGVSSGRVAKRRDVENEEIQMYLSKLKDLVPFMPKNRRLSKLEVIQYVIDYICDLQSALETHPAVSAFDAAAALNQKTPQGATVSPRQPLGVLPSPNTILTAPSSEAPVHTPNTGLHFWSLSFSCGEARSDARHMQSHGELHTLVTNDTTSDNPL